MLRTSYVMYMGSRAYDSLYKHKTIFRLKRRTQNLKSMTKPKSLFYLCVTAFFSPFQLLVRRRPNKNYSSIGAMKTTLTIFERHSKSTLDEIEANEKNGEGTRGEHEYQTKLKSFCIAQLFGQSIFYSTKIKTQFTK